MNREEVLQSYSPELLSQVINICDNLFYNNYLENGILNSREEIKDRIRKEITEDLIDFFGKHNSKLIKERVNAIDLIFIYQSIGPKNSIKDYLRQLKISQFNKFNGTNYTNPYAIDYTSWLLSQNNNDLRQVINTNNSIYLNSCLEQLGVTKEDILSNNALTEMLTIQINKISKKWKNTPYSENPEINSNILIVEDFNVMVVRDIENKLINEAKNFQTPNETLGQFLNRAKFRDLQGAYLDPIALSLDPIIIRRELFRNFNTTTAYYLSDKIFLGINPSDVILIHEFIHGIDEVAFEKYHSKKGTSLYSKEYREHHMFNEVVTDYFANLIWKRRNKKGKKTITNNTGFVSMYSQLFDTMEEFIKSFSAELKETRLRKYPAEEFMRVISKEQFDKIALLCNEIVGISCIEDIENRDELNESKYRELTEILDTVKSSQSKKRQIMNFISRKNENFSSKLENSNNIILTKFAELFYNARDILSKIAQRHISRNLETPIENIDFSFEN